MLHHFLEWPFVECVKVQLPLTEFVNLPATFGTWLSIRFIILSAMGWQCLDKEEVGRHPIS